MKNIKSIIAASVSLGCLVSCTHNFEDINTNPNKFLFGQEKAYNCVEPIIYGTARNVQNYSYFWNNELVQMTAYTAGATRQEHMYSITGGNWQSVWDAYARYGFDSHRMIDLAVRDGDKFLEGVGLVMKVHCLSNLVSLFGDIPFVEAYKGSTEGILEPAFDSQEDVFGYLLRDLDSANVIFSRNPKPVRTGLDGMYDDDAASWRKFANSLKLRLLLRLSGINDKYWAQMQEIIDNPSMYPVFTSNDDNARVRFKVTDPYMSYFGNDKITESDFTGHRVTEQVIKMMTVLDADGNATYEDPRLNYWAKMRSGKWKGTISGCTEGQKNAADEGAAIPNYELLARPEMDAFYMDYSELLFIYAEGKLKGKLNLPETVKAYYEKAVAASMEKWSAYNTFTAKARPIKAKDVDTFLASAIGSFDNAGTEESIYGSQEELVLSQKWLSLYYVLFEPYNEWRRTEYPVLTIGDGTISNNFELPTRFGYPNYTVSTNSANVGIALERMGGANDMHTALVWSYKKLNGGNHRNPYEAK